MKMCAHSVFCCCPIALWKIPNSDPTRCRGAVNSSLLVLMSWLLRDCVLGGIQPPGPKHSTVCGESHLSWAAGGFTAESLSCRWAWKAGKEEAISTLESRAVSQGGSIGKCKLHLPSSFSCQNDRREGMAAFVEKRKANFKDHWGLAAKACAILKRKAQPVNWEGNKLS